MQRLKCRHQFYTLFEVRYFTTSKYSLDNGLLQHAQPAQQPKNIAIRAALLLPGPELEGRRAVQAVGRVGSRQVLPGVHEGVQLGHGRGRHVSGDDGARACRPIRLAGGACVVLRLQARGVMGVRCGVTRDDGHTHATQSKVSYGYTNTPG